jgi:hypothetical protein
VSDDETAGESEQPPPDMRRRLAWPGDPDLILDCCGMRIDQLIIRQEIYPQELQLVLGTHPEALSYPDERRVGAVQCVRRIDMTFLGFSSNRRSLHLMAKQLEYWRNTEAVVHVTMADGRNGVITDQHGCWIPFPTHQVGTGPDAN